MKLYTYDPAPNPRRLGLFMQYKGIELETTQIDLSRLEQMQESFSSINPQGTVPALVLEDGTLMTEVIGMCDYLESRYPERPLMGQTALERALVLSWDHRVFIGPLMAIGEMLRNGNPAFKDRALPGPGKTPQIPELVERGRTRLHNSLRWIDAELAEREFLVGEQITLADLDLLVVVEFAGWVKESVPEDCKHLRRWQAGVQAVLAK